MASAITKKQQESIYDSLNKKVKILLSDETTSVSPFAKELYKTIRGKVKKLEDIKLIEEKIKAGGKINEDQTQKLSQKDSFIQSVQLALETFEVYKKSEFTGLLAQKQQAEAAAEAALAAKEEPQAVKPETQQVEEVKEAAPTQIS